MIGHMRGGEQRAGPGAQTNILSVFHPTVVCLIGDMAWQKT